MIRLLKDLWEKFDKKALWEAVKLPLRIAVLTAVGFIIEFLIDYFSGIQTSAGIIISTLLVALDKYLHEIRASDSKKSLKGFDRGLVPF